MQEMETELVDAGKAQIVTIFTPNFVTSLYKKNAVG